MMSQLPWVGCATLWIWIALPVVVVVPPMYPIIQAYAMSAAATAMAIINSTEITFETAFTERVIFVLAFIFCFSLPKPIKR